MITSRRDYLMRVLDEVSRLLGRVIFKRRAGADQEALETVVVGFQRLFDLDADQVFLLTPDQHYRMLAESDDAPELTRDKLLLYAALSAEAGGIYAKQGNHALARATRLNALRFVLKSRAAFPIEGLPDYAPNAQDLIDVLADEPLDPETVALVSAAALPARSR